MLPKMQDSSKTEISKMGSETEMWSFIDYTCYDKNKLWCDGLY